MSTGPFSYIVLPKRRYPVKQLSNNRRVLVVPAASIERRAAMAIEIEELRNSQKPLITVDASHLALPRRRGEPDFTKPASCTASTPLQVGDTVKFNEGTKRIVAKGTSRIIDEEPSVSDAERKAAEEYFNGKQPYIPEDGQELLWSERINNYCRLTGFPRSLFEAEDGRVVGTWIMGNDYRVKSGLYGGYPAGYLKRIKALFPDKRNVLHLFSGMVDQSILPGDTVDILPDMNPTYLDDAQKLESVPLEQYDLILADPPYSDDDATHYGTTMVKRNVVMKALERVRPGTYIVWLDQVLPQYRKDHYKLEACIGIMKSTNHRFRMVVVFRKIGS